MSRAGPGDLDLLHRLRGLAPALGVTRVAELTGLDRIGLPVAMAVRPMARSVTVALGKGHDPAQAEIGALMEAAETWHAERLTGPLHRASLRTMRELGPTLDPSDLPLHPDARWHEDLPLLWTLGRGLASGGPLWVPFALVHTDYAHPLAEDLALFEASTNGLGAGDTFERALIHALCELIERDAAVRWVVLPLDARRASRVDPDRLADATLAALVTRLDMAGFTALLWDTTGPTAVPSFQAAVLDRREPHGPPGLGHACRPEPAAAAIGALLEAVQVRMTYVSGARDDLEPAEYHHDVILRRVVALRLTAGDRATAPPPPALGAGPPLTALGAALASAGSGEIAVIDLARPEIGLAVVRVVAAGLRTGDPPAPRHGRRP